MTPAAYVLDIETIPVASRSARRSRSPRSSPASTTRGKPSASICGKPSTRAAVR